MQSNMMGLPAALEVGNTTCSAAECVASAAWLEAAAFTKAEQPMLNHAQ
jgi:hypothetical protein